MFTLPLACLLLIAMGQAGNYEQIDNPSLLISYAEKALIEGKENEYPKLIQALEKMMAKTSDSFEKSSLKQVYCSLKKCKGIQDAKNEVLTELNPDLDADLILALGFASSGVRGGKDSFLESRAVIEASLKKTYKQNRINQAADFVLRKALKDMDRLAQLEQDPANREELNKFFRLMRGHFDLDEILPDEKNQTGFLKTNRAVTETATRLFGPASFLHFEKLEHVMVILVNECRRGKMTGVDLASEINKEFGPFIQAGWSDIFLFRFRYLRELANAYLTERGKNPDKLEQVIEELEKMISEYQRPNSELSLYPASYRLVMLVQQGRHAECIREFEKIKPSQIANCSSVYTVVDFYLSAAKSYDALGKKDLALVHQELAFGVSQRIPIGERLLSEFKKSVARDLRDQYAKNNQWTDARNLEERSKLQGLAFEPLPKQPGE